MTPPKLLTIAGSDSGGGAGIQADLKTFAAHGAHGMSAVTAVTAQNTLEVTGVAELSPDLVAAQIDAVFNDLGVDAVKIGMLSSAVLVAVVADRLRYHQPRHVVLDPVMVAKSGDALLRDDAVDALRSVLWPLATVITPNLPETERLTGSPVASEEERVIAARRLLSNGGAPGAAVLVKGGHGEGDEVVDLLVGAGTVRRFVHPRIETTSTHGTGCTLSSAIAARLASSARLAVAVEGAIAYLQGAIAAAFPLGGGHGPVNHFFNTRFSKK